MPGLISGSTLRQGGSQTFIQLSSAQPQLPPTESTSTGFTLVTDSLLRTEYRSSLGNIEFRFGEMWSNIPGQNIRIVGTGTSTVIVAGGQFANTSTTTGALVVQGGVGIAEGLYTGKDIFVNGLRIGKGYEGKNNLVIRGEAIPQPDDSATGQASIAIGYDALLGLETSYANIAIGRYALSSGTQIVNSIAIGDSALKNIGVIQAEFRANITNITTSTPVVIEAPGHNLSTGTKITIANVEGTTELNNNIYYSVPLSSTDFALYVDVNTLVPLDGSGLSPYVSSGTVSVNVENDNNIAFGSGTADNLFNGRENVFIGHSVAVNLNTGSQNILIGHNIATNMIRGTGNISLGGDNLVDGLDNQVNIGSLLYFNGGGYTQINSDTGVGLGTWATATYFATSITNIVSANPVEVYFTETFAVSSGTYITLLNVGGLTDVADQFYYASFVSATMVTLYYDFDLTQPVDGTAFIGTYTTGGEIHVLEPYGALAVLGGAGIAGNLIVSDDLSIFGTLYVRELITATVSTATLALNFNGGQAGSIPYQTAPGSTEFIPIGTSGTVLISNGSSATWVESSSLVSNTASNLVVSTALTDVIYYPGLADTVGSSSAFYGDLNLTYVTTTATTSSYFITGTSVLNMPGSIYSMEGNPDEASLLYTPRVTISATAPENPRVGDFWVNSVEGVELQYINDGGNKIWIQFTGF